MYWHWNPFSRVGTGIVRKKASYSRKTFKFLFFDCNNSKLWCECIWDTTITNTNGDLNGNLNESQYIFIRKIDFDLACDINFWLERPTIVKSGELNNCYISNFVEEAVTTILSGGKGIKIKTDVYNALFNNIFSLVWSRSWWVGRWVSWSFLGFVSYIFWVFLGLNPLVDRGRFNWKVNWANQERLIVNLTGWLSQFNGFYCLLDVITRHLRLDMTDTSWATNNTISFS